MSLTGSECTTIDSTKIDSTIIRGRFLEQNAMAIEVCGRTRNRKQADFDAQSGDGGVFRKRDVIFD